ncbi:MAG: type I polyketide synthase, partial [Pseudomonadota bacterium]
GAGHSADAPLLLGTVKTNIGHLESAAGVAGIIKTALALKHGEMPPNLHFQEPNPRIPWSDIDIDVVSERRAWPDRGRPARGAVSGFGFSGTNVHAILEAPPAKAQTPAREKPAPLSILALSARSEEGLRAQAKELGAALFDVSDAALGDAISTLNRTRSQLPYRMQVQAASGEALKAAMADAEITDSRALPKRIAMLFSGQGAQRAGMGRALYEALPAFSQALDDAAAALSGHVDIPLLDLLWGGKEAALGQTQYTQPALFAVEYALAEMWKSLGIVPRVMLGHSIGEYAAATQAEIFSLEDAARLVAARGRLMHELCEPGAMVALGCDGAVAQALADAASEPGAEGSLVISALNGPRATSLSGSEAAVNRAAERAKAAGIAAKRLDVSHAFHSPLMEPMLKAFAEIAEGVSFGPARSEVISTMTGRKAATDEMSSPDYWVAQISAPVDFAGAIKTTRASGLGAMIEAGPQPVLLGMAERIGDLGAMLRLASIQPARGETQTLAASAGALWSHGFPLDWSAYENARPFTRVALPGTVFQRERYWPDVAPAGALAEPQKIKPQTARVPADIFPGRKSTSPFLKGATYATTYSIDAPTFLDDHRIYGMIVVPGAAHLSMALTAKAADTPNTPLELSNVRFSEVLVIPDTATRDVQMGVMETADAESFEIYSRAGEEADWIMHAQGTLAPRPDAAPRARPLDEADIRTRCREEIATTDIFYQLLHRQGIELGRQFQWVEKLWRGEREALGVLRAPEPGDEAETYFIPPGLLDSLFQSMGATLPTKEIEAGAFIPIAIEKLVFYAPLKGNLRNHVRLRPAEEGKQNVHVSDMVIVSEAGDVIAEIEGLRIHRAPQAAIRRFAQRHLRDALYGLNWSEIAIPAPGRQTRLGQAWRVISGPEGGEEAQRALEGAGAHVDHLRLDTAGDGALTAALEGLDGVVFDAASLETEKTPEAATKALFTLIKALDGQRQSGLPRLAVLTRGLHAELDETALAPRGLGIPGLMRVVANEYPDLRSLRIDLPSEIGVPESALLSALLAADELDECEVALRHGQCLVPRLGRWAEGRAASRVDLSAPYQLIRSEEGVLEDMRLARIERPKVGDDEIEILTDHAGLNFRDVLNALAVYPGDAGPMGGELVGRITDIGRSVEGFARGDLVMAIGAGTFCRHVITKASLARKVPEKLDPLAAATIPVAYVSAWYGLVDMAALKAGEKVLIHAGAGGVGMAAIQLAHDIGAEVFATAGSDEKRAVLAEMGVKHIYSSRDLSFAGAIKAATDGKGVDVVLNSLAGDFITQSVAVTGAGGRFIEIGKRDTWSHDEMRARRPDIEYHKMALDEVIVGDPGEVGRMLGEVADRIEAGRVAPLPHHDFAVTEAVEAYRFMAQAKHCGKVVLRFPHREEASASKPIRSDRAYLITGGFGAIGLQLAERLARAGAGMVALMGRSAPRAAVMARLSELTEETGTCFLPLQGDLTSPEALNAALGRLRESKRALGGVFHAAGALDDALISQLDPARFNMVFDGKLIGALNLHAATLNDALDHFVLFSSAAALFGTPGQSNYAAANGGLDILAAHRRAAGLPALSVNWGPWDEGGMAHDVGSGVAQIWESMGISSIAPKTGFDTLDLLMEDGATQALVLGADWDRMAKNFPTGTPPRIIADLVSEADSGTSGPSEEWRALMAELEAVTKAERVPLLERHLQTMATKVLGLAPDQKLDTRTPLNEMGLDSLMAVELVNQISATSGIKLHVTDLFDNPSIEGLSTLLVARAMPDEETAQAPASETTQSDQESLMSAIVEMSDEEVERRLKELGDIQG